MKNRITITATPNFSKRTFTIRKKDDNKTVSKYRTLPMSKEEFKDSEYNTENDWQEFLTRNSGSYYRVKI